MIRMVLPLTVAMVIAGPVLAAPGPIGRACHGIAGQGPGVIKIAGNFMGGQDIRPFLGNPRRTASYQGCFETLAACGIWQERLQARYPLPPSIATCTPVILR